MRSQTYKVGIPHPDRVLYTDLSHKQAVHPPERKLHKFDTLSIQVSGQRGYNSLVWLSHGE